MGPGWGDGFAAHEDHFSALRRIAAYKRAPVFETPPHAAVDAQLVGTCRVREWEEGARVRLHGAFGFGSGAQPSNGVALSVLFLEDDRSYRSPASLPSVTWLPHALVVKQYDGALRSFSVDLGAVMERPAVVFGIENLGSSYFDQSYITELKLDWYGQEIDLLTPAFLGQLGWHSSQGAVTWGSSGPAGTVRLVSGVTMEDGQAHNGVLQIMPDWIDPAAGFLHAAIDWWKVQPLVNSCQ